jgi:hypothetical protein
MLGLDSYCNALRHVNFQQKNGWFITADQKASNQTADQKASNQSEM